MTREQAEKEIRDTFTEVYADGIIKALEQEPSKGEKPNGTDKEIHGVREELKAIKKELHNLNRILEKRKI